MFRHTINEDLSVSLLLPEHVSDLFFLVDKNRDYLRQWLPWLDNNRNKSDSLKFITQSLEQFRLGHAMVFAIFYQNILF